MYSKFSRTLAFRYLWSKRSEAFITIITFIAVAGVAIGVTVITMVMAVMTGFQHELRKKVVGANSHIVVRRVAGEVRNWQQASQKISTLEGVESVSPFTYNQALLSVEGRSVGVLIRGIQQNTCAAEQLVEYLPNKESLGSLFEPPAVPVASADTPDAKANLPGIVIGRELARQAGLFPGKIVSMFAPSVGASPFGMIPRFKRYVVVGVYTSGLVEYETGLAYVAMDEAQRFFRLGDRVSGLEVRVTDIDKAPAIANRIVEEIGVGQGYYAQDWTQSNKALWEALRLEKRVYFIVLLLIVVMASFSIVSMLIMLVLEKRKDIAIARTLGATTRDIGHIFITMGAVIGLIGTVGGLVMGVAGCILLREYGWQLPEAVFPVSTVPVRIELFNFVLVGICAFAICMLATIYPARRASRLDPSEVLRYE